MTPEQVLEPYDETLTAKSRSERRLWSQSVFADLRSQIADVSRYTFEVHAGAPYSDFGLRDDVISAGARVERDRPYRLSV